MKSNKFIIILTIISIISISITFSLSLNSSTETNLSPETKANIKALSKIKDKVFQENLSLPSNQKILNAFVAKKVMDFTPEGLKKQIAINKKSLELWIKKAKEIKNEKHGDESFSGQTTKNIKKGHKEFINIFKKLHKLKIINKKIEMVEMGAGVGRLTKHVFSKLNFVKRIDLEEPTANLKKTLENLRKTIPAVKDVYIMGAEEFPYKRKYDIVYASYLLENIPDFKLMKFLIKTRNNLKKGGKIIIGENVNIEGDPIDTDTVYHQRIRTDSILNFYFKMCGLTVAKSFPASEHLWANRDDYHFNFYILKRDSDF